MKELRGVRVVHRNWLAIVPLLAVPILFLAMDVFLAERLEPPLLVGVIVAELLTVPLTIWQAARGSFLRDRDVTIGADARGIHIGGVLRLAREDIRAAYLEPQRRSSRGPIVQIFDHTGLRAMRLRVRSEEQGRELLAAIGMDSARAVASFPLANRLLDTPLTFVTAALALVAALFVGMEVPRGLPFMFAAILAFVLIARPQAHVDVGGDGLCIRRSWQKRFIGWGDIAKVESDRVGCALVLRSGERVLLRAGSMRDATLERVRTAWEAFVQGDHPDAEATLLARGERPTAEWLAALRRLTDPNAARYRAPAIPPERLWRIVEDGAISPEARAGAAAALAPSLDEEGRERLRVAASACVAPRVRIALEAAADGEDDALAEALASLEEP